MDLVSDGILSFFGGCLPLPALLTANEKQYRVIREIGEGYSLSYNIIQWI